MNKTMIFKNNLRGQLIGSGVYKKCYDVGDPKYIVKFAIKENDIDEREETIYQLAKYNNLDSIFAKTEYIPIPKDLPKRRKLNRIPIEDYDYAIIQERVAYTVEEDPYNEELDFSSFSPIEIDGYKIDINLLIDMNISSYTWLETVIKRKGIDYFYRLADFIMTHEIYDLHDGNIGYTAEGDPVIFDWLS